MGGLCQSLLQRCSRCVQGLPSLQGGELRVSQKENGKGMNKMEITVESRGEAGVRIRLFVCRLNSQCLRGKMLV